MATIRTRATHVSGCRLAHTRPRRRRDAARCTHRQSIEFLSNHFRLCGRGQNGCDEKAIRRMCRASSDERRRARNDARRYEARIERAKSSDCRAFESASEYLFGIKRCASLIYNFLLLMTKNKQAVDRSAMRSFDLLGVKTAAS